MSDWLPDSPIVLPTQCPECSPELDPRGYSARRCTEHEVSTRGADDARVESHAYMNSAIEAGGDDNRAFCDWLHRRKTLLRGDK
jgi:hypothetical protein